MAQSVAVRSKKNMSIHIVKLQCHHKKRTLNMKQYELLFIHIYLALFQQIQSGYMHITELKVVPNTVSCFAHLAPNRIRPEEGLAQKSSCRQQA